MSLKISSMSCVDNMGSCANSWRLHIDHISGMPDVLNDVPLYIGASESTATSFKNMFVRGATDQLLKDKQPLQEWHFQPDPQNKLEGIVDVFEDGSVFAIKVPGHTPGSTAFLIRTTHGPVLLTGDTCHTRLGWEHTVERAISLKTRHAT